ncbi:head morphogenesis [Escherichia phage K1ind2]|uniref:Putative head protein, SPP1 gp7 family n=1 Tax=Escherichia phage K1ind2 TaxID=698489 RepID=D2XJM1_9CAUD|nr:head morphogenesis [Escherichia phage K1ind2]ADA82399.1 putative head protein, SPP1 gp7 family [Escherichia phage K1ind2]
MLLTLAPQGLSMSLLTSLISHQIWLQRTASGEVKDLAPFIKEMRDEIKQQVLLFGDDGRSTARLNKLLRDLEEALAGLTGDWRTKLTEDLKELAAYEAEWNVKTLTTNVNAEFVTPTAEQVWAAAEFQPLSLSDKPVDFTKLMSGWGETEVARLVTGVKMGFVQGQTTRQIVKNVVGAGGLTDISERTAATVIRTALSHVSNEARNETYRQNDDIIEKYEWVSTLDSRTSTICRVRDGMTWGIGKGPMPPAHPNCRSTTAPVISSEFDFLDKGAKRAAKGAYGGTQVSADTTYYEFLKQQPAWFQDQALGPVRGKIFRNSGISPEEFRVISVDGFGNPLTLKQMAELDKRVADYLKGD